MPRTLCSKAQWTERQWKENRSAERLTPQVGAWRQECVGKWFINPHNQNQSYLRQAGIKWSNKRQSEYVSALFSCTCIQNMTSLSNGHVNLRNLLVLWKHHFPISKMGWIVYVAGSGIISVKYVAQYLAHAYTLRTC